MGHWKERPIRCRDGDGSRFRPEEDGRGHWGVKERAKMPELGRKAQ